MLFGIERWFEKEYILVLFTCICHYCISSMCCRLIHPCVFADRSMWQSTAENVWHFLPRKFWSRWYLRGWLTLEFLCNLGASLYFHWPCRDICFWLKCLKMIDKDDAQMICIGCVSKKKGLHQESNRHPFFWAPRSLKISESQGVLGGFSIIQSDVRIFFQMGWFGKDFLGGPTCGTYQPYLLSTYKSWDDPPSSATVPQMRIMVVNKPFRPWGGPLRFSW